MNKKAKKEAEEASYENLDDLAKYLRKKLQDKTFVLLYAYNGTGKTRLSMAFKNAGKKGDSRDTLYFNAFTEDLFSWDNDLEGDRVRKLKINASSRFFAGLAELEMETRIRPLLHRFVDFDFSIDTNGWTISFSRDVQGKRVDNIKVSRGEENIFIWCFFLVIVQLAIDGAEAYKWVNYIYIDDPISSLDENNAIAVASNLAQLLKAQDVKLKTILSSHHSLFFNVLYNELKKYKFCSYFLSCSKKTSRYTLRETKDTPFFHHVATLIELYEAEKSGRIYTYHFTMLRSVLEKSASFHGLKNFSDCFSVDDDPEGILHTRLINVLSHGNYSLYEPREMMEENKAHFKKILESFLSRHPFNPELFPVEPKEEAPP